MAALITLFGDFFTAGITWMGQAVTFIVATPFLMLGVCMLVAGFVFGLLRRAIVKG